mmetsp:Transcript_18796/g.27017  ORF Transcript_18796/g.27017 Transcript_18796/m.27017 type:complete len:141 (-) Transcript_18796:800-1222(-)
METLYPPMGNDNDGNDIMPLELRKSFESLSAMSDKQVSIRKRKDPDSGQSNQKLEDKKRQVAISTALAVEEEILRLQNGISELEARLAQQGRADLLPTFPEIPLVIPIVLSHQDTSSIEEDTDHVDCEIHAKAKREMIHG